MKFSLILNSRQRVPRLVGLLNSIFHTTKDLSSVEILIRVDSDDKETLAFYEKQLKHHEYENLLMIVGKSRPDNLHVTLNYLAKHSIGKYIFVLNDDVLFLEKDWDEYAWNVLEAAQKPDRILYGRTHDTSVDKPPGSEYASFPIISREGFETLGFIMHNNFVGLGGDNAIHRVYNSVNRVVDLPNVKLDHVYHNSISKIFMPDATAYHMRVNTAKHHVDPTQLDISQDIEKLKKVINEQSISS